MQWQTTIVQSVSQPACMSACSLSSPYIDYLAEECAGQGLSVSSIQILQTPHKSNRFQPCRAARKPLSCLGQAKLIMMAGSSNSGVRKHQRQPLVRTSESKELW